MVSEERRSEPTSGFPGSLGLAELLDQHAELREIVTRIREAADVDALIGLLERLESLLQAHFTREEGEGFLRMVEAGGEPGAAERLERDHREILQGLRGLVRRLGADRGRSRAAVEGELAGLLQQLQRHDAREAELLARIVRLARSDPAAPEPLRSTALEINLQRTAVDVVIPPEQQLLLDITSQRHGVHETTKALLREINHRYVGWEQTLEDLHRRAMSDLPYYLADDRGPAAIAVFSSLYRMVAERASPLALRETAVRRYLAYLEKVARQSDDGEPRLLPALEGACVHLEALFDRTPKLAAVSSPGVQRLVAALLEVAPEDGGPALARSVELLSSALRRLYERWLTLDDPALWWRETPGAQPSAPLPEEVAAISHTRLKACLRALDSAAGEEAGRRARALLALPDRGGIERGYLEAASCCEAPEKEEWENRLEQIHWLIRVLGVEALAPVHEQALVEISRLYLDVVSVADAVRLERFVHETFAALRRGELLASRSALALIAKLGEEALASGDPQRADVVIREMLDLDFPDPGFSGFTGEWQLRVNPAHLRALRTYLALIGANPELARDLIAALVVHLKLGGVLIADTDLFQKDVSRLLNSRIGPIYHQVKHLLRLFPVYFDEIGAEGELRDVSSRIDEIGARKDPLCHFLRKQCHVECNPRLIGLLGAIAHFWATGERAPLRTYLPAPIFQALSPDAEIYAGVRAIFARLAGSQDIRTLLESDLPQIERRLHPLREGGAADREKALLLLQLRRLLGRKYELGHDDLLDRLRAFGRVADGEIEALGRALEEDRHEEALERLLEVLERLKTILVSGERSEAVEDIYRKRHIATGIPSLYGRYREEKLEAAGLTLRAESLANVLFERIVASEELGCATRSALRKVARCLKLMLRALWIDGCQGRGLSQGLAMLEQALVAERTSVDQYLNIFQALSRGVEQLIRVRFLDVYEGVLERLLDRMLENGAIEVKDGSDERETALKVSEEFLRDLIARSLGLQQLDNLVGKVLHSLVQARETLEPATLDRLLSYDAGHACVEIDRSDSPLDGPVYLGNKGYMLRRLAQEGLPLPPGFILTTEVFRCYPAVLSWERLRRGAIAQVRQQVEILERLTGSRLGDRRRPLLLAVRSSAAISMPGVLDTFLNVGINPALAEGLAAHSGSPWGAWDAYRRFVQLWGMGHGLERDLFDGLMREAKGRYGVTKKSQLAPDRMRELALCYRAALRDRGVAIVDDPFEQLLACIDLVLRSWDGEKARAYRGELQVAREWGTAVIVQSMVYGNLNERSGTGVVITCDPKRASSDVRISGDFIVQGQGEDVVSGLVETFPISEEQRPSESGGASCSLQQDFPAIYAELKRHARTLIRDLGMFHQEIEFTFESDDPADLYILQTRDMVLAKEASVPAFAPHPGLERARAATAIGAGGGALSGRVAHSARDIADLHARFPEDPIILLRPDTVPDDIPLLVRAQGMVTALGGATSHAALAAQRLGRTCIVGCRELEVDERESRSTLAGRSLRTGDFLSINGIDGSVYWGRHPTTLVRRERLI